VYIQIMIALSASSCAGLLILVLTVDSGLGVVEMLEAESARSSLNTLSGEAKVCFCLHLRICHDLMMRLQTGRPDQNLPDLRQRIRNITDRSAFLTFILSRRISTLFFVPVNQEFV
jgi:hypothetical protein